MLCSYDLKRVTTSYWEEGTRHHSFSSHIATYNIQHSYDIRYKLDEEGLKSSPLLFTQRQIMNTQRIKSGTRKKSSSSDNLSDKSAGIPQVSSQLQAAGFVQQDAGNWVRHSKSNDPLSERSRRLSKELEDFVERGMVGIMANENGEEHAPSTEAASELQIQIARMFRQVSCFVYLLHFLV